MVFAPDALPNVFTEPAPVPSVVFPVVVSVVNAPVLGVTAPIGVVSIAPALIVRLFATFASGRTPVTFVVRSIVAFAISALTICDDERTPSAELCTTPAVLNAVTVGAVANVVA